MSSTQAANYALYQVGWFASILGAAWQWEGAGLAIALALTFTHVALAREREIEIRLLAVTVSAGFVLEWLQLALGTYRPQSSVLPDGTPPGWLLALWAQFATTFRYSLQGIMQRPARAALFGAIGGPLAFFAADRFGALDLLSPLSLGLMRLAATWSMALVVFSWLTRRWWPSGATTTYRGFENRSRSS